MSRMTRLLKGVQKELKNRSQKPAEDPVQSPESLDVSLIEKASFLQGEQYSSHGNPLHSTALEDELTTETDSHPKGTARRKAGEERVQEKAQDIAETPKRLVRVEKDKAKTKQKGDVQAQRKSSKSMKNQRPTQKTQQGTNSQTRRLQTISENRDEEGRRMAQSEVFENSTSEGSAGDVLPEAATANSQRRPSLSSEELTDEDESFHPSSEKSKPFRVRLQRRLRSSSGHQQRGQKQKRKCSSGSSDNGNQRKRQKHETVKNPIDLDVVLEAFQEFVTHYKETVNSDSVKQAIDAFSHLFEEQLTEMITATKEFNDVKRKAAKINSALNHKKIRLLEAKNELIKSEADVRKLQKEHDELEQRLKALIQGTTFLTNLKELNQRYLKYRVAHPDEPETYDPSCMPAMLLEARSIMGTENQLKTINDKLQQIAGLCPVTIS
ncbi:centromere protein U isoform X1 [Pygocentrus nattereri]|uniref:centromere protein U isoform X1 n=1 Tax=Pygocentrus nattereri TaxID=42514 RepID=UPI0018915C32|nr:centromere protein U isoform X1 [Pygocentrus nattereri]